MTPLLSSKQIYHIDFHGFQWISIDFVGLYRSHQIFMDFNGFYRFVMDIFIDFHGISLMCMQFHGFLLIFMDFMNLGTQGQQTCGEPGNISVCFQKM